ncbi:MAG: ERF family protein, partial [Planctomycetota bacterium]
MNEQTPTKELYAALQAASADIGMAHKSEVNSHDRYKYADLEDYLSAIRPACVKHGLYCYSRPVGEPQYFDRKVASGNAVHSVCRLQVESIVVHPESSGALGVTAWGEGQDRGDKAIYKAITGGRKYSLAMLFGIHTTDDAEKDSPEESTSTTPQARPPQPAPAQPQQ